LALQDLLALQVLLDLEAYLAQLVHKVFLWWDLLVDLDQLVHKVFKVLKVQEV
jgi:hypothetical protein